MLARSSSRQVVLGSACITEGRGAAISRHRKRRRRRRPHHPLVLLIQGSWRRARRLRPWSRCFDALRLPAAAPHRKWSSAPRRTSAGILERQAWAGARCSIKWCAASPLSINCLQDGIRRHNNSDRLARNYAEAIMRQGAFGPASPRPERAAARSRQKCAARRASAPRRYEYSPGSHSGKRGRASPGSSAR